MTTLATNLVSKATTQLLDFNFVGFLTVGGASVGVTSGGLFKLSNSAPSSHLVSTIITKSNTFDLPNLKRFPVLYIEAIAERDFVVSFIVDDQETTPLTVPVPKIGLQVFRVPTPRTSLGSYWSVKIQTTGGYLKIRKIAGVPTILHPGRR